MASTVGNRPAQYRARAQRCRERAAAATDEAARNHFLHDADMWERMADYEAKNPTHVFGLSTKAPKPAEEQP
jgi:hypothetical protein